MTPTNDHDDRDPRVAPPDDRVDRRDLPQRDAPRQSPLNGYVPGAIGRIVITDNGFTANVIEGEEYD